jgi:hypothetical protein
LALLALEGLADCFFFLHVMNSKQGATQLIVTAREQIIQQDKVQITVSQREVIDHHLPQQEFGIANDPFSFFCHFLLYCELFWEILLQLLDTYRGLLPQ